MLIYSISIYAWPVSLLRDLERWIKNFIWSGDINQRKLVTVAWKKVCKPYSQGGLGVRSLITLNDASNLKLCWDLFNSQEQWAILLRSRTFRSRNCITHHIHSTIWSGVKAEFNVVLENSRFIIGGGSTVNFWRDTWCGDVSLEHSLQITDMQLLHTKVKEMIQNHQWHIPPEIEVRFPNLMHMLEHITIPLEDKPDSLAWKHSDSGDLTLRQAYLFKDHQLPQLQWAKTIWCKDIPPSKSLVAWRLMHCKLPTDENLLLRGCNLPSMCSMCLKEVESSFHLFFQCSYAVNVWNWFSRIIGLNLHFNSVEDIWLLCDRNWQPQCRIVILAGLVNIISTIWFIRNQVRFNNNHIPWEKVVTLISSNVSLSENLDFHSSFVAELCGVMKAIETAIIHNWLNLWIETDSNLAVLAFKSNSLVPWMIRNRWQNCKLLARRMNLIITHIYREGNVIADSLANFGLNTDNALFFWEPPSCIVNSLNRNKLGIPNFRFKSY
ncbi:unnamed protein product [Trifolium pratense]|uniref:Uncharacterized protein n=1 Tax=Trifolium pratense TaxID=57577 RepID=A0ACB0ITS9_TRIPR|nr:unnamed protein product [Trifolium pratense]